MADDFDTTVFVKVEFSIPDVGKVFVPIERSLIPQLQALDVHQFHTYVFQRWKLWEANRHIRAAESSRRNPYNPATDIYNQPLNDEIIEEVAVNPQTPQLCQPIVNRPSTSATGSCLNLNSAQHDTTRASQHSSSEHPVASSSVAPALPSAGNGVEEAGFALVTDASPLSNSTPVVATGSSASSSATIKWTPEATQCLVTIRLGMEEEFLQPSVKKAVLWGRIAEEMTKNNHHISSKAANEKFRNMMATYRNAKTRQSKTGESSQMVNWEYFKCFDEVYAARAKVVVPNSQLGSTMPNENEQQGDQGDDNPVDVDNSNHDSNNKKPTRGLTISAYRKRKADIALERLEFEQERHRRRMEVEQQRTAALERTENRKIDVLNNLLQAFMNKAGPSS